MKATFYAHIKEHREIVELFRGYECEEQGLLIGVGYPTETEERFICDIGDSYEPFSCIDIDLDTAQMDLRMAIGTEIVLFSDDGTDIETGIATAINSDTLIEIDYLWVEQNTVKLCPNYLKSVGVEVEK